MIQKVYNFGVDPCFDICYYAGNQLRFRSKERFWQINIPG
jgi:hypothetical protein